MKAVHRAGQVAHRLVPEVLRHIADADAVVTPRAIEPEDELPARGLHLPLRVVGPGAGDGEMLSRTEWQRQGGERGQRRAFVAGDLLLRDGHEPGEFLVAIAPVAHVTLDLK